jgi:hypothetical protein
MQRSRSRWLSSAQAGLLYFLGTFLVAFCLGVIRTVVIAPRVGATIAVLLETPIILVVSWWMSGWCTQRFNIAARTGDRALMGTVAFAVLMLAEFALSIVFFHRSLADYAATFTTVPGAIGLLAQIGFAVIPWLQSRLSPE